MFTDEDEVLFTEESTLTPILPAMYQTIHHDEEGEDAVEDDEDDPNKLDDDEEHRISNLLLHWSKRPSVGMVAFILFIYCIGESATVPTTLIIANKLACNTVAVDGVCNPIDTQILISNLSLYLSIAGSLVALPGAAKVGELSDKYGRKLFINMFLVSAFVAKVLNYLLFRWSNQLHFFALVATTCLANVFGGVFALLALSNSYISDVVDADRRRYSLGLGTAAWSGGTAIGPILANLLISFVQKRTPPIPSALKKITAEDFAPLRAELLLLSLLIVFSIFFLPESRSKKARERSLSIIAPVARHEPTKWNKVSSIFSFLLPLLLLTYPLSIIPDRFKHHEKRNRFIVMSLIFTAAFFGAVSGGLVLIYFQYGILKFEWSTQILGSIFSVTSIIRTTALVFVIPLVTDFLTKVVGLETDAQKVDYIDIIMISSGYFLDLMSALLITFSQTSTQLFVGVTTTAFGTIGGPATSAAVLKMLPSSKTGEYFGAISVVNNSLTIFAPMVLMNVYNFGLRHGFPSLPFYILDVLLVVNLTIILVVRLLLKK